MKQRISILLPALCGLCMAGPLVLEAQNRPDNNSKQPVVPVQPTPPGYTNNVINYVRTWEPFKPFTDVAVVISNVDVTQVKQTTQYFDGLGRLLQTVGKGSSPAKKDLVTPVVYDAFGRERYQYLPYVATGADGQFKQQPFTEQASFMNTTYGNKEQVHYAETAFDGSPLNRPLRNFAPGNSWGSVGGNKPVTNEYQVNAVTDTVISWTLPAAGGMPVRSGSYAPGTLYKEVLKDERGFSVVEFKDKEGQVVLKKVQVQPTVATGHSGWLSTYYIYDDLNNLRFVLSPKAVAWLAGNNWQLNATVVAELCFQYRYDGRKRMIEKWVPGVQVPTELVHDTRNRQVFFRDAVMAAKNQWLVTLYDALDRVTMKALYNVPDSRQTLQNTLDALTGANPVPVLDQAKLTPLSYTYYDNYDYAGAQPFRNTDMDKLITGEPNAEPISTTNGTGWGQITGQKVRVLNTDQWLLATTYYDAKGRVIQVISDNLSGSRDAVSTRYNFSDKVVATYLHHANVKSTQTPATRILTLMSYDHGNRVTKIQQQLNSLPVKTLVVNEYNELGLLKKKTLGNNLESLEYDYNIRGWLKGINKNYIQSDVAHFFGMELSYDYGYTTNQLNGNIAGVTWRSKGDGQRRSYGYTYDAANRLLKADFAQLYNIWDNSRGVNFDVVLGNGTDPNTAYDANGNIKAMTQHGMKNGTSNAIDKLTYTYRNDGNRLQGVVDDVVDPSSVLGDFKELNGKNNQDYDYDKNGNLIQDLNKGIALNGITYNYLNLPDKVDMGSKGIIYYQYDAAGNKLRKTVEDKTVNPVKRTVTDYMGGFIYRNDTLQHFPHEEGRVRWVVKAGQPGAPVYDYFVRDHQQSTRMILTEQTDFSLYAATMEKASAAKENALFSNIEETRAPKPAGYPGAQAGDKNEFLAKLNAKSGGKKIGPSLVLKVMAGDTVQLGAQAFYKSQGPADNKQAMAPAETMLADLAAAFSGSGIQEAGAHGVAGQAATTPFTTNFYQHDYQRMKEKDPERYNTDKPKAYLNFVLFDEQFKLVDENSGVKSVKATPDQLQTLVQEKTVMKRSGYLYVYTSNESAQDVYFDNVTAGLSPGPILEETHYYPFGLTMAGISGTALTGGKYPENRSKYNGKELQQKEFADESGLEWYDYGKRMYDAQLGRWHSIDPLLDKSIDVSPYTYVRNNPITKVDPDGNTDYDVVIKTTKDAKTGAITRTVDISIKYNVINLSGTSIYNATQVAGSGYNDATYSTTLDVKKGEAGAKQDMKMIVNVSIEHKMATNINQVNNAENVMLVVDDVQKSKPTDKLEPAGRAELQGQTAAVEGKSISNKNLVQHEMGHNMGLTHVEGDNTNMMNPTPKNNKTTEKQRKQMYGVFGGMQDGSHHMGPKNAQKEAKEFLEKTNNSYDQEKAKKAGF
ncbi:RHS repeat-associated core domain-containing protein [Chitinophaga nivalis]|uniref:RHS repeat-associated core domain-containing protein n=1 Tax=Chitinophaga nivalis TaxID=2991709 RepID=A0ABT3IJ01_9BACT|nr:RHS repeat-associated core domain-containing protein [Chitinophaga nivalis]MCW3466368.1 RHS repeat-associated core domain-containing protein [Chitinophaga nivalis]MCW3483941.1 RHS repeat-associated core domain-containing protein [Chitinophaga nivalis]